MAWLKAVGYLVLTAGILTPILGPRIVWGVHGDHRDFSYWAAILCLTGLVLLASGRRSE